MRVHVQGMRHCRNLPTGTCGQGCYLCKLLDRTEAMAWNLGEIAGLADPTRLPAPTTNSLDRTVVVFPETEAYCRVHIKDAERLQGLTPDHTHLPDGGGLTAAAERAKRFMVVGNGLQGEVR